LTNDPLLFVNVKNGKVNNQNDEIIVIPVTATAG